jgi:hypothetical protein
MSQSDLCGTREALGQWRGAWFAALGVLTYGEQPRTLAHAHEGH